jgi:Xaa-Pro dipeptidase
MLTAFSLATYRERQAKVRARIKGEGLDALVVAFPDNINYLTGFDSLGYLWYQALIVAENVQPARFFTRTSEIPCVHELSTIEDAVYYDIATEDPVQLVARALTAAGYARGRIGLEMHAFTFSPDQYLRLRKYLPDATFVDTVAVAEERLIKSAQEVEYQRSAARMADHAMRAAFAAVRPGVSEVKIAGEISRALGEAGSEYAGIPPIVATGRRSTMTHAMPQRHVVSAGDVVILELAGVCNRYHAVLMRTAVVGKPSARVQEVADLLTEGFNAALAAVKPGAPVGSANTACNAVLDRLDLSKTRVHRIGYSLGIAYPPTWLEAMIVDEADPHVFEANMSFTIEPNLSLYDEGFGLKLGDTVLCTSTGCASLSELAPSLTILD